MGGNALICLLFLRTQFGCKAHVAMFIKYEINKYHKNIDISKTSDVRPDISPSQIYRYFA